MALISQEDIQKFQERILNWYAMHKRDLPWRKTRDPYRIIVSEVMLQQTQVNRVIPKYEEWFRLFPTVEDLAGASIVDVLRVWSSLGYNRRALYLQRLAQELVKRRDQRNRKTRRIRKSEHQRVGKADSIESGSDDLIAGESEAGGVKWPKTEEELMKLPGIGKYTARALLCFAFDKQVAVVDTNVRKVILSQFELGIRSQELEKENSKFKGQNLINGNYTVAERNGDDYGQYSMTDKEIWAIAEELVPFGRAYDWNQALMDYASTELVTVKIPIVKQAKFHGSRRYYRGKLVRILLAENSLSFDAIGELLEKKGQREWVEGLVAELVAEGFVRIEKETVLLAK